MILQVVICFQILFILVLAQHRLFNVGNRHSCDLLSNSFYLSSCTTLEVTPTTVGIVVICFQILFILVLAQQLMWQPPLLRCCDLLSNSFYLSSCTTS